MNRLFLLVLVVCFLSACGGSGGGGSENSSSSGSETVFVDGGGTSGSSGVGPAENPSGTSYSPEQQAMISAGRAVYMSTDMLLDVHLNRFDLIDFLRPFVEANGPNPAPPPSPTDNPNTTDPFPNRYILDCAEEGVINILEWDDLNNDGQLDDEDQFIFNSGSESLCVFDSNQPGLMIEGSQRFLQVVTTHYVDPILIFDGNTDSTATNDSAVVSDLDGSSFRIDDNSRNRCRIFYVRFDFALPSRNRLEINGTADLLLDQLGGCAMSGGFYAYVDGVDRYDYAFENVVLSVVEGQAQLTSGSITVASEDIGGFTIAVAADPAFLSITSTAIPTFTVPHSDIFVSLNPVN